MGKNKGNKARGPVGTSTFSSPRPVGKQEKLGWPTAAFLAALASMSSFYGTVTALGGWLKNSAPLDFAAGDSEDLSSSVHPPGFVASCGAKDFLASVPVPGLHLVCVDEKDGPDSPLLVSIYPRSRNETALSFTIDRKVGTDPYWFLHRALEKFAGVENRTVNPWAMFTEGGKRITNAQELIAAPTVFVYEGGSFIWPGVEVGHKQMVTLTEGAPVVMETISMQPLVFSIDDFLTLPECDYIQAHASPRVAQSGVSLMDKDKGKAATEWRTSSTYFMPSRGHAPLQAIDARVASLTRVPTAHQELVQVLRYREGEKYDAHHDFFDPSLYAKDPNTLRMTQHGKVNRMATVLWYLSDVQGGGMQICGSFSRANYV